MVAPGLEHDPDVGAPPLIAPRRVDAEHPDVPVRAHPEALEDLDRGALAGAVRAEQDDDLATSDGEIDAGEHVLAAVAHPEVTDLDYDAVVEVIDLRHCSHRRSIGPHPASVRCRSATNDSRGTTFC